MNRFVSLLLVALSLAAVTLAQPAQAQWVVSKPYYAAGNTQSSDTGTTVTSTPVGHVNITATPSSTYASTSGNYGGNVSIDYIWIGGSNPQGASITMTQSLESTGTSGSAYGYGVYGNSNAGGQQAYGDFSHTPTGWDTRPPQGSVTSIYGPGVTPPTFTRTFGLGASISAYYYNNPGSSIVTADVTFSSTQQ